MRKDPHLGKTAYELNYLDSAKSCVNRANVTYIIANIKKVYPGDSHGTNMFEHFLLLLVCV